MTPRGPELRLQIVVALAGLMVLAFLPLFFAVASLGRATLRASNERDLRLVARAVVEHADEARARGPEALRGALARQVAARTVRGICAYGEPAACAGDLALSAPVTAPYAPRELTWAAPDGPLLEVVAPVPGGAVALQIPEAPGGRHAPPLVGLVAIYMAVFGVALLFFTYSVLTRVIVRPVDDLVAAAERVARGATAFVIPKAPLASRPRELAELGDSLENMTARLVSEQAAMRAKVDELTQTTTRLTEARAQLVRSERLASVGRLAAGVAHEIGNPIAALMGLEELMLDGDVPAEDHRDFLERMRKETNRIHGVVRDLLDFARPETPSLAPSPPAEIARVFDDVVALLRPQRAFRALRLEADAAPSLRVAMSAERLTQIVLNLALNAADALEGTGTTERPGGEKRITLRARRDGPCAVVEVEDTGPGVPPSMHQRIFEPFVTTKEVGEGTGLGLAVCHGLVDAAGGQVTLDAGYADGARFVVRLPLG